MLKGLIIKKKKIQRKKLNKYIKMLRNRTGSFELNDQDEDFFTVKKFINDVSAEIFCPMDPIPDVDQFTQNTGFKFRN